MTKIKEDKIIALVKNKDIGFENKELYNPLIRYAARGIVIRDNGDIAIFNKKAKNEYKLPGGGIEENENIEDALKREIFEETGCEIDINDFLGITIEEKGFNNFKQISYIYVCKVKNDTMKIHLTEKEQDEGGSLIWVPLDVAYQLINNCYKNLKGSKYDDLYRSLFMVKRDAEILKYYIKIKPKETQKKS